MHLIAQARNRRGQSMAEYAIVLTVVIGAIVAMQLYVKRGLQGKVKDVTDDVGGGLTTTKHTSQYEPYYTNSTMHTDQNQKGTEAYQTGGTVERKTEKEDTFRTGTSTTGTDQTADSSWK